MWLQYWEDHAALCGSVLVFNTGRSLGQIQALLEEKRGILAVPDALITAVGTKVRRAAQFQGVRFRGQTAELTGEGAALARQRPRRDGGGQHKPAPRPAVQPGSACTGPDQAGACVTLPASHAKAGRCG